MRKYRENHPLAPDEIWRRVKDHGFKPELIVTIPLNQMTIEELEVARDELRCCKEGNDLLCDVEAEIYDRQKNQQ